MLNKLKLIKLVRCLPALPFPYTETGKEWLALGTRIQQYAPIVQQWGGVGGGVWKIKLGLTVFCSIVAEICRDLCDCLHRPLGLTLIEKGVI